MSILPRCRYHGTTDSVVRHTHPIDAGGPRAVSIETSLALWRVGCVPACEVCA
jgi:5-methylcytosine-specific restriction endonuclease McrA